MKLIGLSSDSAIHDSRMTSRKYSRSRRHMAQDATQLEGFKCLDQRFCLGGLNLSWASWSQSSADLKTVTLKTAANMYY